MLIETAKAASAAEISSNAMRYVTVSNPMPSYSSGVHIPRKPSLPTSSITSRGKWLVRSHSAANGSILSRANSRASSTTCSRTSVAVDIEPLPRFSAELPRGHHPLEQRRRTVLVLVEPVLEHLHDGETDIETDQVGERQRTQRMVHAELHDLIDRLRRRHPLVYTEDRFIDHRHEDAIRHESGRVVDHDGGLAQLLCDFDGLRDHLVPRPASPHYFDERHQGDRIHEMHADHPARLVGVLGNLVNGDGRGVAGKDGGGRRKTPEVAENLEFDLAVLCRRLDHVLSILRRLERR